MYESKNEPLLSRREFALRMLLHIVWAMMVVLSVVLIGVFAHLWLETHVSWQDALLNTALIVGGIGPYIVPTTMGGKIFFSLYGIFIGLMFVATLSLILAPIAHRIIHVFHMDDEAAE